MSYPEVVVTGLGATTPLGGDVASSWKAMVEGRSGVRLLSQEWATELPVRIAAQVMVEPSAVLPNARLRRLDRCQSLALIAAMQAWDDAKIADSDLPAERLAVSFGTGMGGLQSTLAQEQMRQVNGPRGVSVHSLPMGMPNGAAAWIGVQLGAKGGVHTVSSACATGAEAIALGRDIIRSGRSDVVVAGGTEAAIGPLSIAGFSAMRAMSTRNDEPERASRPWDKRRDGFVIGEGAAAIVLERADHAVARKAHIYARLAGAGLTSDGYDIVQPDPNCEGGVRAMRGSIRDAGLVPGDIDHVNAHATSTPIGDMGEIRGIRAAIGDHPIVTSTKSMTGHLLGAAGALESIATILSICDGLVPPTINLDTPDRDLDLQVAAHKAVPCKVSAALTNSFGFGGHNVALVFTRN